jgi:hypothetical protein
MIFSRLWLLLLPLAAQAGFHPLFNAKNLSGWSVEGPRSSFFVHEGALHSSGRAHLPNWIRTAREYENFRLRFEYRPAQWAEMAVLLRAPRTERPQHAGAAIFLGHDFHNKNGAHVTGAVLGLRPPAQLPPPGHGQWRRCEIELIGLRLKVSIDGVLLQDFDLPDHRLPRGHIGFPDMGYAWSVRAIEIEELGAPVPFTDLLASGSLDAWQKQGGSGEWSLEQGVLRGSNGHSVLYAPPVFSDFEFTACVRTHHRVNSGVFFRGLSQPGVRGFEVQIYSPVDAVYPTGSIYNHQRSRLSADLENRWFLLQVRVQGPRVQVWVDGEPAAETAQLPAGLDAPGRIGFQIHLEDTSVEFRDIRVRPL